MCSNKSVPHGKWGKYFMMIIISVDSEESGDDRLNGEGRGGRGTWAEDLRLETWVRVTSKKIKGWGLTGLKSNVGSDRVSARRNHKSALLLTESTERWECAGGCKFAQGKDTFAGVAFNLCEENFLLGLCQRQEEEEDRLNENNRNNCGSWYISCYFLLLRSVGHWAATQRHTDTFSPAKLTAKVCVHVWLYKWSNGMNQHEWMKWRFAALSVWAQLQVQHNLDFSF